MFVAWSGRSGLKCLVDNVGRDIFIREFVDGPA